MNLIRRLRKKRMTTPAEVDAMVAETSLIFECQEFLRSIKRREVKVRKLETKIYGNGGRAVVLLLLASVALTSGCQVWDSPGYYAADGQFHPPVDGVFTVLAKGAGAAGVAGVPWAGAVGGLLGLVGGVGAFMADKKNKRNLQGVVKLLDKLKPELVNIANDQQLEAFILKHAPEHSALGRGIKKAWRSLKTEALKTAA